MSGIDSFTLYSIIYIFLHIILRWTSECNDTFCVANSQYFVNWFVRKMLQFFFSSKHWKKKLKIEWVVQLITCMIHYKLKNLLHFQWHQGEKNLVQNEQFLYPCCIEAPPKNVLFDVHSSNMVIALCGGIFDVLNMHLFCICRRQKVS